MSLLGKVAKKSPLVVKLHTDFLNLNRLWQMRAKYLAPGGYFNSFPSDSAGEATPWYTYAAIAFLKGVIQKQWKVFEYGCGYSTVFWSKNCAKTVSVEHDEDWFNRLKGIHPDFDLHLVKEGSEPHRKEAADLVAAFEAKHFDLPVLADRYRNIEHGLLNKEFANYAGKITEYPRGEFDVIVVDGMARSLCGFFAAEYLAEGGVILLDNSDRWQYNDLQNYLIREKNFKRIDFHGLGPLNPHAWTTSVFFKDADFLLKAPTRREPGAGDLGL